MRVFLAFVSITTAAISFFSCSFKSGAILTKRGRGVALPVDSRTFITRKSENEQKIIKKLQNVEIKIWKDEKKRGHRKARSATVRTFERRNTRPQKEKNERTTERP